MIKINVIKYPKPNELSELLKRPNFDNAAMHKSVKEIMNAVKEKGDDSIAHYTLKFDKVTLKKIQVLDEEIDAASTLVDRKLKKAITIARKNIHTFHKAQQLKKKKITTTKGVVCWRENRPIQNVGLYIPGGSAPLFSTVLMLAIPATIAKCKSIILCTPPDKNGNINPAILYTAKLCGIKKIYKIGGAQAIAALTFGTQTIQKVEKIFGPGNQYVTIAKQLAQQAGIAIDIPAGPSEVLVVGDETCNPVFVAADLLSQAEHGLDSQVIFVTYKEDLISKVKAEVLKQLELLPRKAIASIALQNSKFILVKSKSEAVDIINKYAPEHLILAVKEENYFIKKIDNVGSVFIGNYTPESAGDYASGTNHTLPTNGYANVYGGVSLDAFVKKITYQKISKKGLENLGSTIEIMAEAENLFAHKNAVSIRLKK